MKNFFIDFDGVIVNQSNSICRTYNNLYCEHEGFVEVDTNKPDCLNYMEQCKLLGEDDISKLFEHDYYFESLEFSEGASEILNELKEEYKLIICTIGTNISIPKKALWIQKNMPFIEDTIFVVNKSKKINKGIVDMKDSIFIDDYSKNLDYSNANFKICFGEKYSWNSNWEGVRANNWREVKSILNNNK